jgi:hypothetical protein
MGVGSYAATQPNNGRSIRDSPYPCIALWINLAATAVCCIGMQSWRCRTSGLPDLSARQSAREPSRGGDAAPAIFPRHRTVQRGSAVHPTRRGAWCAPMTSLESGRWATGTQKMIKGERDGGYDCNAGDFGSEDANGAVVDVPNERHHSPQTIRIQRLESELALDPLR